MHYCRLDRDRGPAGARNAGAALARGRFILFMDSDVLLAPDWLHRALGWVSADPGLGIVAGKLGYASRPDRVNAYGGAISWIGLAWDAYERAPDHVITGPAECLWVPGAVAFVPRDVFECVGGFDPRFQIGYEDSDFGWRANLAGFRCLCVPDLVAYHRVTDRAEVQGADLVFHICKNRLRSLLKNLGWLRLAIATPLYLAYATADSLLRGPRLVKLRALWWNLAHLPDTLRMRAQVQWERVRSDADICHLFSRRLFPPETIRVRHQRQNDMLAGDPIEDAAGHS
jgi:GT2 family glycosyltransferase